MVGLLNALIENASAAMLVVVFPLIIAVIGNRLTIESISDTVWAIVLGIVWSLGAFWLLTEGLHIAAILTIAASATLVRALFRGDAKARRVT